MSNKTFRQNNGSVPAEPEVKGLLRVKPKRRGPPELRNVFLPTGHQNKEEDDDEGSSGTGKRTPVGGEAGTPLPESEYYDIHELIRSKHKGKVEAGRKFHERIEQNNGQTAEFNDDTHPLAAMAYFSGIDNQDETPLPGESTDEEIKNELEFRKRLQLQKQLGLSNGFVPPTPKPF